PFRRHGAVGVLGLLVVELHHAGCRGDLERTSAAGAQGNSDEREKENRAKHRGPHWCTLRREESPSFSSQGNGASRVVSWTVWSATGEKETPMVEKAIWSFRSFMRPSM